MIKPTGKEMFAKYKRQYRSLDEYNRYLSRIAKATGISDFKYLNEAMNVEQAMRACAHNYSLVADYDKV